MQEKELFIGEFESIIEAQKKNGKPYWEISKNDVNRTLFSAYHASKRYGNGRINFGEAFWDTDIELVISTLRRLGITEFTFSSRTTGYPEIFEAFKKLGAVIQDIVSVKFCGDEIPAVLFKIV